MNKNTHVHIMTISCHLEQVKGKPPNDAKRIVHISNFQFPTPQRHGAFVRTSDMCCWVEYEHDDYVTTPITL
jgi:hypothetical protein